MALAIGSAALPGSRPGDDETRVSLVQGEYRLSVGMEQHQVSLPMARSLSVIGFLGPFDEWSALSDEGCRAAALRPRQPRFDLARGR